ncbi:MaoC family dehydratase [Shimia haliotis]|uniref:MaoC like domain-containing protein n=1 Tax=Shimia haliotis TaxID=1280847 RepID=A0A1I4EUT4_9RHOB|nr:MaoC family dehydratase [Shimia haliotis]SFL09495.1 MaoC like domain-containing protein [Shimia haliotis]
MSELEFVDRIADVPVVGAVEREVLTELLAGLLPEHSISCPLSMSALLLAAPQLDDVRKALQPPSGLSVVHETQRFVRDAPDASGVFVSLEVLRQRIGHTARFVFRTAGGEVNASEMETRLRFIEPSQMLALKGAQFSDRLSGDGAVVFSTDVINRSAVQRYVSLAKDDNPIHVSDASARQAGLSKAVVPGMLLCALSESYFGSVSGGTAREMKTRFMAAVPVEEPVKLVAKSRGPEGSEWAQARVICVGADNVIAAISDIRAF